MKINDDCKITKSKTILKKKTEKIFFKLLFKTLKINTTKNK